jgi:hypothetical protein
MEKLLYDSCEALRDKLELLDSRNTQRAFMSKKGRTLYYTSPEARELRRSDAMFATGGR